jgi:hypothetical protein
MNLPMAQMPWSVPVISTSATPVIPDVIDKLQNPGRNFHSQRTLAGMGPQEQVLVPFKYNRESVDAQATH